MILDEYEIIFEGNIELRKYLILRLKTRGQSEHYYVFLTDGIMSKRGNLVYLIVSISSSKRNYDGKHPLTEKNPIHPYLKNPGFVSFRNTRVLPENKIMSILSKSKTRKVILDADETDKVVL